MGERKLEKKKRVGEKREKEKRREKLFLLSSFLGYPVVSIRWSKRQSSSLRREL